MLKPFLATVLMLAFLPMIHAAPKAHVVTFGKVSTVKLFLGADESKSVNINVRPLYVDGKLKEFTTGETHDITDRQFAVQRAYRVNDSLPEDARTLPQWRWQRGGWLLVDRTTGRIAPLRLPDFDPFYSEIAWYRDYAAYCGVADTGDKLYAVVAQLGAKKPVLRKFVRPIDSVTTEPECGRPTWQRQPPRVTFDLKQGQVLTFAVRGRAADVAAPGEQAAGEEEAN